MKAEDLKHYLWAEWPALCQIRPELITVLDTLASQHGEIAALHKEVEALRGFLADIASVAGRDVPDAIDNDGQPYQSQSLSDAIDRATLPTKETGQ